jgi:hypothetical protein
MPSRPARRSTWSETPAAWCSTTATTGRVRCDRTNVNDVQRPVAIDLRAEQAKLDSLLAQRARVVAERDAPRPVLPGHLSGVSD